MNLAAAFGSGLVFAIGLGFSGMLKPEKVIGFLELTDPTLLFVMGPAVAVYLAATWKRRARGPQRPLDAPLITGAAIFGAGWGSPVFARDPRSSTSRGPTVSSSPSSRRSLLALARGRY